MSVTRIKYIIYHMGEEPPARRWVCLRRRVRRMRREKNTIISDTFVRGWNRKVAVKNDRDIMPSTINSEGIKKKKNEILLVCDTGYTALFHRCNHTCGVKNSRVPTEIVH